MEVDEDESLNTEYVMYHCIYDYSVTVTYSILFSLCSHVGVVLAPVEGQLLLFLLVEPDKLFSAL